MLQPKGQDYFINLVKLGTGVYIVHTPSILFLTRVLFNYLKLAQAACVHYLPPPLQLVILLRMI